MLRNEIKGGKVMSCSKSMECRLNLVTSALIAFWTSNDPGVVINIGGPKFKLAYP